MMMNNEPDMEGRGREQRRALMSSLADGQLRGAEFARAVSMVSDSGEARATWHAYHVVGDVLRSSELAACADDAAFVARLQTRLQRETARIVPDAANLARDLQDAADLAPKLAPKLVANYAHPASADGINSVKIESANESRFGWKLLAGVASFAAVGAIGWSMVVGLGSGDGSGEGIALRAPPMAPQLAQVPVQPPTQLPPQPQVMIRDPHLDALLAAHKQFGGTPALQMSAGFLRNATFESPAR